MKLGIVLPSFMYSDIRKKLASDAFYSLARCETLQQQATLLLLVRRGHAMEYDVPVQELSGKFHVFLKTDEGLDGTEPTLAYGTQWMLDNFSVDYVTWMGDDALFHPLWLWKLEALINRHPNARSWSVYRSAYEWFHKTLDESAEDVLVRSICGHGMTFSRQEWKEWGIDWQKLPSVVLESGGTLDLVHSNDRQGERWVTKKSFIEHTGKVGVHCNETTPEYARDFEAV